MYCFIISVVCIEWQKYIYSKQAHDTVAELCSLYIVEQAIILTVTPFLSCQKTFNENIYKVMMFIQRLYIKKHNYADFK